MSHNKIKVDGQAPNSTGEIPLNLSSYINETSISSDQVIKYDGANWINDSNPATVPNGKIGVWFRNLSSLGSSGTFNTNDYLMVIKGTSYSYKYSKPNYTFNNATTANTAKNNSNYMESIDIPEAGTYLCICTTGIQNRRYKLRWESNSGAFSSFVDIDDSGNTTGAILLGIVNTTGADIVRVVIQDQPDGKVSLLRTHSARGVSVHIIKLS